jgi:hypothetical protein
MPELRDQWNRRKGRLVANGAVPFLLFAEYPGNRSDESLREIPTADEANIGENEIFQFDIRKTVQYQMYCNLYVTIRKLLVSEISIISFNERPFKTSMCIFDDGNL